MSLKTYFLSKIWNLSPNLILIMVKRCSYTNLIQNSKDLSLNEIKFQNRWPFWRFLLYFYLAFAVFRFWAVSLVLSTGRFIEYQQYDVLMSIGMSMKLINFNSGIFISPMTIFAIHFDYTVYVKRFNNICRLPYDIIVLNPENFFTLNPHMKPTFSLREPIKLLKESLQILTMFYKPLTKTRRSRIQWNIERIPHNPNLNESIRLKLLLLTWFCQLFISIFLFCAGKKRKSLKTDN